MGMTSIGLTDGTATDLIPAVSGERPKLLSLWAQNYEAAGAAANFLIIMDGTTERARFPLIASGAPLVLGDSQTAWLIPLSKFTSGNALKVKLSATGTVWLIAEFAYGK